ncbi:MAG: hypothetical protein JO154_06500 [Chitinophaga sp.]|uniref:hypothetical protein n=1 Tax=Chitinophaga sp. TaxID=1869181 RepID=UPI0025BCF121|nr:hypothetical protein [Chitinophaga sp.]MBV8252243.1 hypothetical protein [Chitinophaga sp.]
MKKFLLSSTVAFSLALSVKGQSQVPPLQSVFESGNSINADNKFLILNRPTSNSFLGLNWQTNQVNHFFIGQREIGDNNFHIYSYGTQSDALTININNSFVGVGTMNPLANLHIQKTSTQPAIMIGGNYARSPRLQVFGLEIDPQAWMGLGTDMDNGPYEYSVYFPSAAGGRLTFGDYNGTAYTVRMSVLNNGNVGIGTSTPKSKLAVAGTITAQKVKVTMTEWPDYVFQENYPLPSLNDLKQYLNTHKHLPDMPAAAEVEQNGLDVGDMNKRLLQKVEELTLYLLQQQEEITALKARLQKVENR